MSSVKDHYEDFLAANYVWAFGDYESNAEKFSELMERFEIKPEDNACVVDLGCGPGYQSIALADAGFDVIAVDISSVLLQELRKRIGNRKITLVEDDILNFAKHCSGKSIELIICIGDVLAHLQSMSNVALLFKKTFQKLVPGGNLLIGFRDQTLERTGVDRVIPFYSDENKIMTTFLEYSEERVTVTDVIYERAGAGWHFEKSEYQKLRLRTKVIKSLLIKSGFQISTIDLADDIVNILAVKQL